MVSGGGGVSVYGGESVRDAEVGSRGQLGALMAESFCERILSCAKQVLHAERLSLKPEEYEKIVILRMNRAFMEYMRQNHAKYAKA